MSMLVRQSADAVGARPLPVPVARVAMGVRPATPGDVAWIDALQKPATKQVGWMPRGQLEGHVSKGNVLIAETTDSTDGADGEKCGNGLTPSDPSASSAKSSVAPRLGYLIAVDRYFKRDDVGIIYQMNVTPTARRSLVAATLLKAQFERSAYGCRLYCCWCAQDLEANRFWEAMGFVPIAFRAGSPRKGVRGGPRVHIFWQKRIRRGDETTPWWFPAQTGGGALREDRIVLPIPPGVHWSEVKAMVLPGVEGVPGDPGVESEKEEVRAKVAKGAKVAKNGTGEGVEVKGGGAVDAASGGLSFGGAQAKTPPPPGASPGASQGVKRPREKRPARKNDPRYVAAARELRDRWQEAVADGRLQLAIAGSGKYDVTRAVGGDPAARLRRIA